MYKKEVVIHSLEKALPYCEIYLQLLYQVPTVSIRENPAAGRGRGKETTLKAAEKQNLRKINKIKPKKKKKFNVEIKNTVPEMKNDFDCEQQPTRPLKYMPFWHKDHFELKVLEKQ